jgi:superfamily I DNA/RNA helicase
MNFSDEQKKAINCTAKNILVTARAGSGKTRVLSERAKRLLENGVLLNEILIFAFNNKAVDEINERLGLKIAKTFHSFAYSILNQGKELDRNLTFDTAFYDSILDDSVSKIKLKHIENIKHIFVDEFQDFTDRFFNIINKILKLKSEINFFAVGDDWQSINSFMGADLDYFTNFEKYFPNPIRLYLLNNYRSGKNIVEHCNDIMQDHVKKSKSILDNGQVIVLRERSFELILDELKKFQNKTVAIITQTNKEKEEINNLIRDKQVSIITAHSSKGLEFDVVFIWGETLFFSEHKYFGNDIRKLIYVAHSRAKEKLYIFDNWISVDELTLKYKIDQEIFHKSIEDSSVPFQIHKKNSTSYKIKNSSVTEILKIAKQNNFELVQKCTEELNKLNDFVINSYTKNNVIQKLDSKKNDLLEEAYKWLKNVAVEIETKKIAEEMSKDYGLDMQTHLEQKYKLNKFKPEIEDFEKITREIYKLFDPHVYEKCWEQIEDKIQLNNEVFKNIIDEAFTNIDNDKVFLKEIEKEMQKEILESFNL